MKRILAAFGLLAALAACAAEQPPPPAQVNHTLPPKIGLDVQVINLADRSGMQPVSSPYNSNHFSPTISDAVKQWASDRLQAQGQSGQAIIVIKDASLIEQPLPIQQGMDGWFTRQQGTKYIARAEVSIEASGHQGFAMADAVATRSVTLPESPSAIEKQDFYYTLLNGLMKDLGLNLESSIQMHMSGFIVAPQGYSVLTPAGSYAAAGDNELAPVIIQAPVTADSASTPMVNAQPMSAQPMAPQMPMTSMQQNIPLSAQMQAQMQAVSTQDAVAMATVPSPPPVAAAAPTVTISQSPWAQTAAANAYVASGPAITQVPLPAPQSQPQAPVFGSTAVPTVPDLASSPDSFPPQASTLADMSSVNNASEPSPSVSYDPYTPYPAPPKPQEIPIPSSMSNNAPQPSPMPATYYAAPQPQQMPGASNAPSNASSQPQATTTNNYYYVATPQQMASLMPQPLPSPTGSYTTYAAAPRTAPATIPLSGPVYAQ